jgi:hypothetical protein
MTKIVFHKRGEDFVRIESEGHTGYAGNGEDIVCAAISALTQGAALGVLKVVGVKADYRVDEEKGSLYLDLPRDLGERERHDSNVILETLYMSVTDLAKGYSEYIQVEVK